MNWGNKNISFYNYSKGVENCGKWWKKNGHHAQTKESKIIVILILNFNTIRVVVQKLRFFENGQSPKEVFSGPFKIDWPGCFSKKGPHIIVPFKESRKMHL